MNRPHCLLIAALVVLVLSTVVYSSLRYEGSEPLTVHILPQSHCDPGWKRTVEGYYEDAVKHILDSVTDSLTEYPERRFIWAETSYFSLWWSRTTDEKRAKWRRLLERRQVEFVIGGWVMSDNAVTTYSANIEQMTLGHKFLKETFGVLGIPRTGWDVDPFGLSRNVARLYREMNFDYHIIARVDYKLKQELIKKQHLEFKWKFDNETEILTSLLHDSYCTPYGFIFEEWDFSVNATENAPVTAQNVQQRSEQFLDIVFERQKAFRTSHQLFPFGCDFLYRNASINFNNITRIMDYVNNNKDKYNVNMKFSLLTEYFDTITKTSTKFPSYTYDFLPYADQPHAYWTGYYTSRPELKRRARESEHYLRTADMLFTLSQRDKQKYVEYFKKLELLRQGNGYTQHHDAITGTEALPVLEMYFDYINNGTREVKPVVDESLSQLLAKDRRDINLPFKRERDMRQASENSFIPLVLFNSLGWKRAEIVTMKTRTRDVVITDSSGRKILADVFQRDGYFEISFETENIPPVGYIVYFVRIGKQSSSQFLKKEEIPNGHAVISNDIYDVSFENNKLVHVTNRRTGVSVRVGQNLMEYHSMARNDTQSSGAYIFRAESSKKYLVSNTTSSVMQKGVLTQEIEQVISPYAKQVVRLYNSSNRNPLFTKNNFIEIEYTIGVMAEDRELVSVFKTDISNRGKFYTDNNAFETLERIRGVSNETEASNFCPVQYSSFIRDSSTQFVIMTDQSRGVASQVDGELEIMLHRRTSIDDERGLGKPLNDTSIVSIVTRIMIDKPENSTESRRTQPYLLNFPVDVFQVDTESQEWKSLNINDESTFSEYFRSSWSGVLFELPSNVHLVTLGPYSANDEHSVLVRLHNIADVIDDSNAKYASVDLHAWLSSSLQVKKGQETYLSANQAKSQVQSHITSHLKPTSIRTYLLEAYLN